MQSNPETTLSTSSPNGTVFDPGSIVRVRNNSTSEYDCGLCAKTFASKGLLTRHVKSHSLTAVAASPPLEAAGLTCDQPGCSGRSFPSQLSLAKHLKSQHQQLMADGTDLGSLELQRSDSSSSSSKRNPGEKRFQCGQCSKRFPTSKDLKRHDVVHTGNREFQCSFCSHRFGRKDHRMRHEKKTHANEMQLSSSPISPTTMSNNSVDLKRQRWRHVSSPSVASTASASSPIMTDLEMTMPTESFQHHVRIRAMSTCEQRRDAPLYASSCHKNGEMSPESLIMEEASVMSPPDFSASTCSMKEESSEDTCHSSNGDDAKPPTSSDLDWIMSDLIKPTEEANFVESVLSPSSPDTGSSNNTPEPSSLSPPGLYPPSDIIPPISNAIKLEAPSPPQLIPINPPSAAAFVNRCAKQVMSDILTRTKNPVLPSVYIDNSSLIVPEPSKQKYHNPHPLLSPEDMDDYYEAFMDDKDITETLFHV